MNAKKYPIKAFLCYAHEDYAAVRSLYKRLVKDDVDVWFDKENLRAGSNWEYEIRKAVRESNVVIVCLSKNFSMGGFRKTEVQIALEEAVLKPKEEIFIIPVRLEECDTPDQLRMWHWVDLFRRGGYYRLVSSLNARAKSLEELKSEEPKNIFVNVDGNVQGNIIIGNENDVQADRELHSSHTTDEGKIKTEEKAKQEFTTDGAFRNAENIRIAREQAEKEQRLLEKEKAEREQSARYKVEQESIAYEKAETERIARQKAKVERIAKQKADNERKAREIPKKQQSARLANASLWSRLKIPVLFLSGLLVVGILCLLTLVASTIIPAKNTPSPSPTFLKNIVTPTNMHLPTVTTEVTPTANVNDPKAYYTETFDGNLDNYTYFNTGKGDEDKMSLKTDNGYLVFDLKGTNLWIYVTYNPYTYTDVALELVADNRGKNNNNVSLLCRYDPKEGWYEFNIANNGLYWIYAYDATGLVHKGYNQIANGGSTAIKTGRFSNTYNVSCVDDKLSLSINGKEVTSVRDTKYQLREGKVGFSVSSFDVTPILVNVDSFTISEP